MKFTILLAFALVAFAIAVPVSEKARDPDTEVASLDDQSFLQTSTDAQTSNGATAQWGGRRRRWHLHHRHHPHWHIPHPHHPHHHRPHLHIPHVHLGPTHCAVSGWGRFGGCSRSCGGGTRSRSRHITRHPKDGWLSRVLRWRANGCPNLSETHSCNTHSCPVHCAVSGWGGWGGCSRSCGTGLQYRHKSITRHPKHGGHGCPATREQRHCNTHCCAVHAVVSGWAGWSGCTKTCGTGTQTRRRSVARQPSCGGNAVPNLVESRSCATNACPVHCAVSGWGVFGPCSAACAAPKSVTSYKNYSPKTESSLFVVGSQRGSQYKTITIPSGYSCAAEINKSNWAMSGLPHATCGDRFQATVSGNKLTVKRIDAGGLDGHGWGMSLRFKCSKAGPAALVTIKAGNSYADSTETFSRPLEVSVNMRQMSGSSECGVISVFPQHHTRHSGYNAGMGWWASHFGAGVDGAIGGKGNNNGVTSDWHNVRINVGADGYVRYYLDNQLRYTVKDNKYQSGIIRLGYNCRDYEYKDLTVSSSPTHTRARTVTRNPAHGGAACPVLSETASCNSHACTPAPTRTPTEFPTTLPPTTDKPSFAPTHTPTEHPTDYPTHDPTDYPTPAPTHTPTPAPSHVPTEVPTSPSVGESFSVATTAAEYHLYSAGTGISGGTVKANQGNYFVDSARVFKRPADVSVMMRQMSGSSECGVISVFPQTNTRHSGYNAGMGWWANHFGAGVDGAIGGKGDNNGVTSAWHNVRINVAGDGKVYFYVDGQLRYTVTDNKYQSGIIRLGYNCRNYEYKALSVKQVALVPLFRLASTSSEYKQPTHGTSFVSVCKAPSTSSSDAGYTDSYRGWYDVQGCGQCNDYCRWVGDTGSGGNPAVKLHHGGGSNPSWWSCRLAGTSETYSRRPHFSSFPFKKCSGRGATGPASAAVTVGAAVKANQGNYYVDTHKIFKRPADVSVMMRQMSGSSECGVISVFPQTNTRHSGYNAGMGWWANHFGAGVDGAIAGRGNNNGVTSAWHNVRINVAGDGKVYFYVDGQLRYTVTDNKYQSGIIRLGYNCRDYEYRDLVVNTAEATTATPTHQPTATPTQDPTATPTEVPTPAPSHMPSDKPTHVPSPSPTELPTAVPSPTPTEEPTPVPTQTPTEHPTTLPPTTEEPSFSPTHTPTEVPTPAPTHQPTEFPTYLPTVEPTEVPSPSPTHTPTEFPTRDPTSSPTEVPTSSPTEVPSPSPTDIPTVDPTHVPTASPTDHPTHVPTADPTEVPTTLPPTTDEPSFAPSPSPTEFPTAEPSFDPTEFPTWLPTSSPTFEPSFDPTLPPTSEPTVEPTAEPTEDPTSTPSDEPTGVPSFTPSAAPTLSPTDDPVEVEKLLAQARDLYNRSSTVLHATMDMATDNNITNNASTAPAVQKCENEVEAGTSASDTSAITTLEAAKTAVSICKDAMVIADKDKLDVKEKVAAMQTDAPSAQMAVVTADVNNAVREVEEEEVAIPTSAPRPKSIKDCIDDRRRCDSGSYRCCYYVYLTCSYAVWGRDAPSSIQTMVTRYCPAPEPTLAPSDIYVEEPVHAADPTGSDSPSLPAPPVLIPVPTTTEPSVLPSDAPTKEPTAEPSGAPTGIPTEVPTSAPTGAPTEAPTTQPTYPPTELPTAMPTHSPTEVPTTLPPTSDEPTFAPTSTPTERPTSIPTHPPTEPPTHAPSATPTDAPSYYPSHNPTERPTHSPSPSPTGTPVEQTHMELALAKGRYGTRDLGAAEFNRLFNHVSPYHIVKRVCQTCSPEYREIYYRRFTSPTTFAVYDYLKDNWFNNNNKIHSDFNLYSSYGDAVANRNRWAFCNYNDPGIGFPRDCGIRGYVGGQWNSWKRAPTSHDVAYYIDIKNGAPVNLPARTTFALGLSKGGYGLKDVGATEFNRLFNHASPNHIVKRVCGSCSNDYKEMYYRRHTQVTSFPVYDYMKENWRDSNNKLHSDFDIYSTYADAKAKANAWAFCNYNDPGIGFPRDCGKRGYVGGQWNSWKRVPTSHAVQYFVEVVEGTKVHEPVTHKKWTSAWGGNGGGALQQVCPKGSYINYWKIRTGSLVDRIQGRCSNGHWLASCGGSGGGERNGAGVWGEQVMHVRTGSLVDRFNNHGGHGGGAHALDCGAGYKISGYNLRCGSLVDKVQLECRTAPY